MDLAPVAQTVTDALSQAQGGFGDIGTIAGTAFSLLVLYAIWRVVGDHLKARFMQDMANNWRLALLGATGVVLSLASGWTTWDGMRNFTQEPVLSLMITFGIQGVMLIVAWLIGESFATGMNARAQKSDGTLGERLPWFGAVTNVTGMTIGLVIFASLAVLIFHTFAAPSALELQAQTVTGVPDSLLYTSIALVLMACLVVLGGGAVWGDYAQALRVTVRSAVLWVMFLACMATSVFFSFDSLFSTIFPPEERARAAELRAQNQVAGVVNDIGSIAVTRRIQEAEQLFNRDEWVRYDRELDGIIRIASEAPDAIRAQIAKEMQTQQERIAALQEQKADAEGQQATLTARKTRLGEELNRIASERPEAAARVAEFKAVVSGIEKRLDEQRAVTLAEERGVEGSGKVGRGPLWRAAKAEERKIEAELEVANRRLSGHRNRLDEIDRRTSTIKAELAQIDGDLAKLRGAEKTAERLIAVAQDTGGDDAARSFDPAAGVNQLEKSRQAFRQEPTQARLADLQRRCLELQSAALRVDALRGAAQGVDCDPGAASEAAAPVFALNTGIAALQTRCIGGDKLPQTGGADALFAFARSCVQDSGLPSDATNELRRDINIIELNRDDKAHRFVVTTNAFNDGNKLAYLALAIAIAIDSLVFMSGLFGANALRSPLSDVPSHKGRSAKQLEDIVENALLPDKFENASLALEAIHPVARDLGGAKLDGWTHEVVVPAHEIAHRARLLKVLNAGATISAVARDPARPDRFFVRGEFVEYLAGVAKKAFETDGDKVRLAELKKILIVALQPNVGDHADLVIGYLKPISEKAGFSSEVCIERDIRHPGHRFIVQKAINAGTTLEFVQKDDRKGEEDRFYLHKEFYRTLAIIASEYPRTGQVIGAHPAGEDTFGSVSAEMAAHPSLAGAAPARAQHPIRPQAAPATSDGSDWSGASRGPEAQHNAHAPQAKAQPNDYEVLDDQVTAEFLRALLLGDEEYDWALTHAGEATAATQVLDRLVQQNDKLGSFVNEIANDCMSAISRVYAAIANQVESDVHAMRVVDQRRREIEELLPLLLLAPGGRYHRLVVMAIEELEAAESHADGLRGHEQLQLEHLRSHRRAIEGERSAGGALQAISAYIAQNSEQNSEPAPPADGSGDSASDTFAFRDDDAADNVEPFPRKAGSA